MLNTSEMKTRVSSLLQKGDATYLTKILGWLNLRYDQAQKRYNWPALIKTTTVTTTAATATVVVAKDVRVILDVHDTTNDIHLTSTDSQYIGRNEVSNIDQQGIPRQYVQEEDTVASQPTSSSVITFASSSASDTATVRVRGISGGEETTESITLNGTTAVSTTNAYTRVDTISKSAATAGKVTGTSNSGSVTVVSIAARDVTSRYTKLRLVKIPSDAITYTITYKYRAPRLEYDEDVPVMDVSEALVSGAYAWGLKEQRQHSKAAMEEANFTQLLGECWDEKERSRDYVPRFIPHIERPSIDQ